MNDHKRICKLCDKPYADCAKVSAFCYAKEDHKTGICYPCHMELKRKHMQICDGCCKPRRDVQTVGHDSNGDPDGPDYCFICRAESSRGKYFDVKRNKYVYGYYY